MSLAALELWMQRAITHPGSIEEAIAAAESAGDVRIAEVIRGTARLSASAHLDVHREMYRLRMERTLADDHPATAHAMGARKFSEVAQAFIARHPSRSFTLEGYGEGLAAFVATHSGLEADARPWLADLVRFEAAVARIHSTTVETTTVADEARALPEGAFEDVRLVPIRALRILTLDHPVAPAWQAWIDDRPIVAPRRRISRVVVHRSGNAVRWLELTRAARDLLSALASGSTLGAALADLADKGVDVDPQRVFRWLRTWVAEGLFTRIEAG